MSVRRPRAGWYESAEGLGEGRKAHYYHIDRRANVLRSNGSKRPPFDAGFLCGVRIRRGVFCENQQAGETPLDCLECRRIAKMKGILPARDATEDERDRLAKMYRAQMKLWAKKHGPNRACAKRWIQMGKDNRNEPGAVEGIGGSEDAEDEPDI